MGWRWGCNNISSFTGHREKSAEKPFCFLLNINMNVGYSQVRRLPLTAHSQLVVFCKPQNVEQCGNFYYTNAYWQRGILIILLKELVFFFFTSDSKTRSTKKNVKAVPYSPLNPSDYLRWRCTGSTSKLINSCSFIWLFKNSQYTFVIKFFLSVAFLKLTVTCYSVSDLCTMLMMDSCPFPSKKVRWSPSMTWTVILPSHTWKETHKSVRDLLLQDDSTSTISVDYSILSGKRNIDIGASLVYLTGTVSSTSCSTSVSL